MDQEFDQEPEFCQEVVAVLVASIVASIIDPMGDADDTSIPPAPPSGAAPPGALQVAGQLASLMNHYEARVAALQQYGMPEPLAHQYRAVHDLLIQTSAYQLQTATFDDPARH